MWNLRKPKWYIYFFYLNIYLFSTIWSKLLPWLKGFIFVNPFYFILQIMLTKAICFEANKRIFENVMDLEKGQVLNNDENIRQICDKIIKANGYAAEHPLTRNWWKKQIFFFKNISFVNERTIISCTTRLVLTQMFSKPALMSLYFVVTGNNN